MRTRSALSRLAKKTDRKAKASNKYMPCYLDPTPGKTRRTLRNMGKDKKKGKTKSGGTKEGGKGERASQHARRQANEPNV